MTHVSAVAVPISELFVLGLAGIAAGFCLFVLGFRLLARKHLIPDMPTSPIASASMGVVEVSGRTLGPYTVTAAITANPCLLYRTVAWQQGESRRQNEWKKIAEEMQYLPFFVDDGTGQLQVDARGAEFDLERDYCGEFDASPSSVSGLPEQVSSFLARNGVRASRRIRVEEWTIKPNDSLFFVGTLADNIGIESTPVLSTSSGDEEQSTSAPEVIRLSPEVMPSTSADMTLQGKIAAALTRAGIPQPEALAAAATSSGTEVQSAQPIAQIRVSEQNRPETSAAVANLSLACPLVLRKGDANPTFLISFQSRRDVIRSLRWKSISMIFGGAGLMLMSIYVLLLQARMV